MKFSNLIGLYKTKKPNETTSVASRSLAGDSISKAPVTLAGLYSRKDEAAARPVEPEFKSKPKKQPDAAKYVDTVATKIRKDHAIPPSDTQEAAEISAVEPEVAAAPPNSGDFDFYQPDSRDYDLQDPISQVTEVTSVRLAEQRAVLAATSGMSADLDQLSEQIALLRGGWSSMASTIARLGDELRRADETENERDKLRTETLSSKLGIERLQRELGQTADALKTSDGRNVDLRMEIEALKFAVLEAGTREKAFSEGRHSIEAENGRLREELALLAGRLDREVTARETVELVRVELTSKLTKAQHQEADTRNRAIEISVENEKLSNQIPALVAEQESLHNRLEASERERTQLRSNLAKAKETIASLESDVHSLKGQTEAQVFAESSKLDMLRNRVAELERDASNRDETLAELESQLRVSEQARQALLTDVAETEKQLEAEKRDNLVAKAKLSDMHLNYTSQLLGVDSQREYAERIQENMEAVMEENRRLKKYESLYRSAESQVAGLRARFALLAGNGAVAAAGSDAGEQPSKPLIIGPPSPPALPQ